jgi:hypothetical protein
MRNGYFLGNALDRTQDIEGEEDEIPDLDVLHAPFTIYHRQGSVCAFFFLISALLYFVNDFNLKKKTHHIMILL